MCARRADGGVHDKELIKPPCPLRAQRFDGMKHTPRVVIPPHRNVGIALCEGRKNPLKASRRNILFLCCRWQIPPRILLFPIGAEISFYGSFYHLRWRWPASHLASRRPTGSLPNASNRAEARTHYFVTKSAARVTPCGKGHSTLRSLAPQFQTKPASLGFCLVGKRNKLEET